MGGIFGGGFDPEYRSNTLTSNSGAYMPTEASVSGEERRCATPWMPAEAGPQRTALPRLAAAWRASRSSSELISVAAPSMPSACFTR